jgi:hypothetical protein
MEEYNTAEYWGMNEKNFIILMHISQFAGYIAPMLGFLLPLIMWLTNKDKNSFIDEHGRNIINWLISLVIYAAIAGFLCLILIGFVLLGILAILAIIFPIIAAIKASNGEIWEYPLSIKFLN